jgi:hypothetical protein
MYILYDHTYNHTYDYTNEHIYILYYLVYLLYRVYMISAPIINMYLYYVYLCISFIVLLWCKLNKLALKLTFKPSITLLPDIYYLFIVYTLCMSKALQVCHILKAYLLQIPPLFYLTDYIYIYILILVSAVI